MAEPTVAVGGEDAVDDGHPVAYLRVLAQKDLQESDNCVLEGTV